MSSGAQIDSATSLLTPRNILAAVLVVLTLIFIFQNRSETTIELFWVSVQSRLWLTLVVILLLGWIAGLLTRRKKPTN
jgi:putative membrane protein